MKLSITKKKINKNYQKREGDDLIAATAWAWRVEVEQQNTSMLCAQVLKGICIVVVVEFHTSVFSSLAQVDARQNATLIQL